VRRQIDGRIRFLTKRIEAAEVVDPEAPTEPSPTARANVSRLKDQELSPAVTIGDLESKSGVVWYSGRRVLIRVGLRSVQRWHTLLSVVRSFRGHIEIIHATEHQSVSLGLALERDPAGHLQPCNRTVGRSDGAQLLTSKYPRADLADLQVFLLGFDEGARWAQSTSCSASSRVVAAL